MPGVVEGYVAKEYQSPEFGSVWNANVVMPDGRLGMSERRSHFVFHQNADHQFEAHLVNRSYLHQDGHIVNIRDYEGRLGHRCMGSFGELTEARQYAQRFIADYNRTAREEHAYAVKHQQREDYYAVHGAYPKREMHSQRGRHSTREKQETQEYREKPAVRGPRVRL